jgi:hypothetical protein
MRKNKVSCIITLSVFIVFLLAGMDAALCAEIGKVQSAITRSAEYLIKSTKADGMFMYYIDLDPDSAVNKNYNILRHAGTIYAMSMYYQLEPGDNMRSAIKHSAEYLRDECIAPVPERENLLAVWSRPEVTKSGKPLQAELGGAGLGLMALLSAENIYPGFTSLSVLRKLGNFILYMHKEDGSFYSKYIPSMEGNRDSRHSLYYPGEAALGLLMLYEKDPSDTWIKPAIKALVYLANNHKDTADHWTLLAMEKLFSLRIPENIEVPRELLLNHAIRLCEIMLKEQVENPDDPSYKGGFSKEGKTTPTAVRLEGLLGALTFIPKEEAIRARIESSVQRGVEFLVRAQIKEGEFKGAIPRAIHKISQNQTDAKNFNRRATQVRVDYVQHALCAMIKYVKLFKKTE